MSSNREDFASPPQSSAEAASHVIELLLLIFLLGSLSTFKRALIKFVPTSILWLCGWLVTLTFLAAPISIGSKVLRALAKTVPKEWRASTPELLPLSFERDLDGGGYVALFVFVISTLFCGWKGIQAWQIWSGCKLRWIPRSDVPMSVGLDPALMDHLRLIYHDYCLARRL